MVAQHCGEPRGSTQSMRPQVAVTVQCVPVKPLQHKEVVPRRLPGCPDRGGGRTSPSPTRTRIVDRSTDKVALSCLGFRLIQETPEQLN
eukprot:Skav230973  [mRNA]  locus=scaffold644:67884:68660:+ [translate_table: standard]